MKLISTYSSALNRWMVECNFAITDNQFTTAVSRKKKTSKIKFYLNI